MINTQIVLEKCDPFLSSEATVTAYKPAPVRSTAPAGVLAVTIARQSGSGAHAIAEALAEYLGHHGPDRLRPWRVFDRNLVDKVLEDHQLPVRYARFMPEDRVSEFGDALEELLGAHPACWTLLRQVEETVLELASKGNVILIGRGANVITRPLPHVFHVRLVGSLENRVKHCQDRHGITRNAALRMIRNEDRGRKRYLKKYFDEDLDDPLLYNLILNTDLLPHAAAAQII